MGWYAKTKARFIVAEPNRNGSTTRLPMARSHRDLADKLGYERLHSIRTGIGQSSKAG